MDGRPATWASLGLSPWLASACTEMGLRRPTPIQAATVGPALEGRDILGSAETGSGKTAAFALPILQALSEDPFGVFAVVLSPARELASQIADTFTALGAHMQVRVAVVVGGVDMMHQALELAERPHVVIGTPGRLADHLRSSGTAATMRNTRFVVIDEADRLLELGFSSDLGAILERLPSRRQTLLFSATMSRALQRLQKLALRQPHVADLAPQESVPAALALEYIFVPANVRDAYLAHVVRGLAEGGTTGIVFTASCRACEELSCTLKALDVECAPLHSQQPQARRLAAIRRFKQGSLKLLVATDVAARGIDIPQVETVVHHNVPALPRDFIHRCGRTARAGRSGRAITIVSQYDVEVLLAIEASIGRKMDALEPPEDDVMRTLHEVAAARRAAVLELTESGFLEKEKERKAARKAARAEGGADGDGDGDEEAGDAGASSEDEEVGSTLEEEEAAAEGEAASASSRSAASGGATEASGTARRGNKPKQARPHAVTEGRAAAGGGGGHGGGAAESGKKRRKKAHGAA